VTYADSSFLCSLYLADANTARAQAWLGLHPEPLPLSPLHRLELATAFARHVTAKRLTSHEIAAAWKTVDQDLAKKLLFAPGLSLLPAFAEAERLARQHGPTTGARSFDVLHVACAARLRSTAFLTFDTRQRLFAESAGLNCPVI
jgi:predicted nucleic acid-binding protein